MGATFLVTDLSNPRRGQAMSSDSTGSVTILIRRLRAGSRGAVAPIWERYFERLARLAYPIVRYGGRSAVDENEEDAALSAIESFCDGLARGLHSYVDDREGLWRLLVTITERKALQQVRRWQRVKCGGGRVLLEADLPPGSSPEGQGLDRFVTVEPTPDYIVLVRDQLRSLLDALENPYWRQTVLELLEGCTVEEIAKKVGRTRRCVYVWIRAIRETWKERLEESVP
jgi:DNA-directed RNA polymerase specialized sigma24 family protein